jgi:hypothetical protein
VRAAWAVARSIDALLNAPPPERKASSKAALNPY